MADNFIEKNWDYTIHAKYYQFRPNYCPEAIDILIDYVRKRMGVDLTVADIGAGTGNLSIMLDARGLRVISIEPNDEMAGFGIERTKNTGIKWIKATGINTTLADASVDWVTFGSSFNVLDRAEALRESHRILKPNGCFTCMWNNRDLNDPIQSAAEEIILRYVPDYTRGARREDQRSIIENSELFKDIFYIEIDFWFHQTIDNYINAWKSVKNKYWDLSTEEGIRLLDKITGEMRKELPAEINIKYTTRAWTAQISR